MKTPNGIALFGPPGSGKTTTAKLLHKHLPDSRYIENSSVIVKPALSLDSLPPTESEFIDFISKNDPVDIPIEREKARQIWVKLKDTYSDDVIAKSIVNLHQAQFHENVLIISGVRGSANASYLKAHGYLVIYLKPPMDTNLRQLSRRDGISVSDAEEEIRIEESIFDTQRIEAIAHASIDPSGYEGTEVCSAIMGIKISD